MKVSAEHLTAQFLRTTPVTRARCPLENRKRPFSLFYPLHLFALFRIFFRRGNIAAAPVVETKPYLSKAGI